MNITRIVKNVFPAVIVMAAGLFGMNFVYNTYMKDGSTSVISLEPSAGDDATSSEVASEAAMEPSTTMGTEMPKEMAAPMEDKSMMKADCSENSADKSTTPEGTMMEGCAAAAETPAAGAEMGSEMMKETKEMMPADQTMAPAPESAPAVEDSMEEAPAAD